MHAEAVQFEWLVPATAAAAPAPAPAPAPAASAAGADSLTAVVDGGAVRGGTGAVDVPQSALRRDSRTDAKGVFSLLASAFSNKQK